MRVFTLLFFFSFYILFAKEIVPYRYITASEAVSDFVKAGEILVIGTKEGIIDIYDLKSNTIIDKIVLKKQTNILGDEIGVLIPSVDYLNAKLVFVSRKLNTYGELYVYEEKKLIKILDTSEKITFEKIKFVDANRIIINTMGNELILFDIKKKKFLYRKQLNLASFSDFVLSEDKKYLYTTDETPLINKIEINSGNIVEQYQQANKRDIFSVDYKNGLLLSGGKDSRVVLYKTPSEYKITMGEFFIYSVGLNPDATKAAFTKNENDEISVIDSKTLKELYLLKGHQTTIIKIDFYAPNELITADEGNRLMFWKLN